MTASIERPRSERTRDQTILATVICLFIGSMVSPGLPRRGNLGSLFRCTEDLGVHAVSCIQGQHTWLSTLPDLVSLSKEGKWELDSGCPLQLRNISVYMNWRAYHGHATTGLPRQPWGFLGSHDSDQDGQNKETVLCLTAQTITKLDVT